MPELKQYEKFLVDWHYFRKQLQEEIAQMQSDEMIKALNMKVLQLFYLMPYEEDFYGQFAMRLTRFKEGVLWQ